MGYGHLDIMNGRKLDGECSVDDSLRSLGVQLGLPFKTRAIWSSNYYRGKISHFADQCVCMWLIIDGRAGLDEPMLPSLQTKRLASLVSYCPLRPWNRLKSYVSKEAHVALDVGRPTIESWSIAEFVLCGVWML
jgi:hypothetical protein